MKKKIIHEITVTATIAVISIMIVLLIVAYYLTVEVESKIPQQQMQEIQIETSEHMSRKVFTISPKNEKQDKTILYFHGGAYMAEMTDKHWEFLQKLCKDTKSTIIVPDYPLAPKYTCKDVLNMSQSIYKEIINRIDTQKLILMGDSAGGGLALGLEEYLSQNNIELPSKTILISPWLDVTMLNPKIKEVQPYDKDLNKFKLCIAGFLYARANDKTDYYFTNPINGNLTKLKNVIIYTGTYDILNPDCHVLQEKAKNAGTDIIIREYNTAPHIWIINKDDNLSQKGYQDLLQDLN